MDGMLEMVSELEIEIDKLRLELSVKESFLNKMKDRIKADSNVKSSYQQIKNKEVIQKKEPIDIDTLFSDDIVRRETIIDKVKTVVSQFGDREFTVAHVDKLLKATFPNEVEQDDMSMRPRISTALTRLKDDGMIDITFKGAGNVPNRYKFRENNKTEVNDLLG